MKNKTENLGRSFLLILTVAIIAMTVEGVSAQYVETGKVKRYGIATVKADSIYRTPRELPAAVDKYLSELLDLAHAHPEDFSYPWVDWRTDEVVIDVASDVGAQLLHTLKNESNSKQRLRRVKYSWADLRRITDNLLTLKKSGDFPELDAISEIRMDWENNRLVGLVDDLNDQLLGTLGARYKHDSIAVSEVAHRKSVPPDSPSLLDVLSSTSSLSSSPGQAFTLGGPIWETRTNYSKWRVFGGSRLNISGGCTNGFSWYYGGPGNIYGMITAAHCIPNGGSVFAPTKDANGHDEFGWVWPGRWENWKPGVGTCAFDYTGNDRCPDPPIWGGQVGDIASIQMEQYSDENAWIFGKNGPAKVKQIGTNSINNSVCTGGAVSGELCGWRVIALYFSKKVGNELFREVHEATKPKPGCATLGDSGGPVYYVRDDKGIMAKGIINAVNEDDDACYVYYTDIKTVEWTFGGSLHTQ